MPSRRSLELRVCGIAIRVACDDARFLSAARRRYAPFLGGSGSVLEIDLSLSPRRLRRLLDEPRVTGARYERHDVEAEFRGRRVRATIVRSVAGLDSLLRIALARELARRGGFLCHAAAFDGFLLPGRSGAGKSTLGRKVPPARLLADELVGVLPGRLWGTPFWGDFRAGRNDVSRRLEALLFLDRRAPRGVHPLGRAEALRRLLGCVVWFEADATRVFRAAARVAASAPCFVLSYDARTTGFKKLAACIANGINRAP
jgi:hypothetical protein